MYHLIKFRKSVMNRSSIKQLFWKISQYSQKKTCVGVFFDIIMQVFSHETFFKQAPTQVLLCQYCEILKNTYFEKHWRTAV